MQLVLNEQQLMLAESARSFVSKRAPLGRLRTLRDHPLGFDPEVWRSIAELGWTGMPFAEADGGLGLGLADLVCLTEEFGRALMTEPFVHEIVLCGQLLASAGTARQKQTHLAPVISGEAHIAFAHAERRARFEPFFVETAAVRTPRGFTLSGEKIQVIGATAATTLIVLARTRGGVDDAEGLSLFLVPHDSAGMEMTRQWRIDGAPASLVRLRNVQIGPEALLGEEGRAAPLVERALDRATVALCGEMLGGMSEALDRTLSYLKERVQFGVLIGTFQALQHRAARLFIEVQLTRSAVMAAARALDENTAEARSLTCLAKARANDAFLLVANEAIQMHGGIGMTDEHDIGFFLKRARAAEMTFGDSAFQRARFARLNGF